MTDKWKDKSTFSQGDKERITWLFCINTNRLSIQVHRHVHYPGEWLLTCRQIGIEHHVLKSKTINSAKREAIGEIKRIIAHLQTEVNEL